MAECKIDPKRMDEARRFLRSIGASEDTVDVMMSFLSGIEMFQDAHMLYKKGRGDCNIIAPIRCAELRRQKVKASPMITSRKRGDGGTTYHALVRLKGTRGAPDTSEDPSILLGMGGASKVAERAEEVRKNRERRDKALEAARYLVRSGRGDPAVLGRRIDEMCFVPLGGPHRGWFDVDRESGVILGRRAA